MVGQIVGSIAALTLLGATHIWGAAIGALLAVGAGIALTGGFHEDGLADTADGLGGGMTRARRLEIMKDSRLGTYGALALMLTLALRVAALASITQVSPWLGTISLMASHGLGRSAAVGAMRIMPYGGDPGLAKEGKPDRASTSSLIVALLIALWPISLMPLHFGIGGILLGVLTGAVPAWQAFRLIGGRTGDILGAVEQSFELGFLLAIAGLAGLSSFS